METTCLDLDDTAPARRSNTDDALLAALKTASLEDTRLQFKTVARSLGASCDVDKVLARDAAGIQACDESLKGAFKAAQSGPEQVRKLAVALKAADINEKTLTQFPVRALRRLDLSGAVVRGIVVIGDEAAEIIDDLAASAGNFKGMARALANRVAAELLAHALDVALDALEEKSLATRPAISRRACHAYRQAQSRPLVTSTMLRRTILRSATIKLGGSGRNEYSGIAACRELSSLADGACEKMAKLADTRHADEFVAATLDPTRSTQEAFRAFSASPDEIHRLKLANAGFATPEASLADALSKKYLDATRACPSDSECTLEKLNVVVSLSNTYELKPSEEQWGTLLEKASGWEDLGESLRTVGNDVRDVRGSVSQISESLREKEATNRMMMAALLEIVRPLKGCREAVTKTIEARENAANALLGPGTVTCGTTPSKDEAERTLVAGTRSIVARMRRSDVCDLAHPFEVDISADAIFDECSPGFADQANRTEVDAALTALASTFATIRPAEILVIGHSDKSVVDPRSLICKKYSITDNWMLSKKRAETILLALSPRLAGITLTSRGHGAAEPVCTEDSVACLAHNRRVSFRLRAAELSLDLRCAK